MPKRGKLPAKRSTTLSRRQAVKLVKPKKGAAPKAVKLKRRTKSMTKDDNGDKGIKSGAKAVPDAALTQEQVDSAVKIVISHPGGNGVSKPDDLVRKVHADIEGYTYPPAKPAE
jgi:hypothetical protein